MTLFLFLYLIHKENNYVYKSVLFCKGTKLDHQFSKSIAIKTIPTGLAIDFPMIFIA